MPILESAELVRIPCRRCPRERLVYVDRATREALAYGGSGTPAPSEETRPAAFVRLPNAPGVECHSARDLDRAFISRRLAELNDQSGDQPDGEAREDA